MRRYFFILGIVFGVLACSAPEELKPGDAVWIQWTPQLWYHGRIESRCAAGFKVRFDDQDEKCSPPELLAKDISPTRVRLEPGMAVLAQKDPRSYAPATIVEKSGLDWRVQFQDGASAVLPLRSIRLFHSAKK